MTLEEAEILAKIIATADNGCSACVQSLCDKLTEAQLGFTFTPGGPDFTMQPAWSDDPEDAETYTGVIVRQL